MYGVQMLQIDPHTYKSMLATYAVYINQQKYYE
jgi:hypothetical protein